MHKSAEISHNLLQNLLQWSRAQTGKIEFKPNRISLPDSVSENIELLLLAAQKKQIELTADIDSGIFVMAYEDMINSILRNLITNAIKFTLKGGMESVSDEIKENLVEINVKDTGVGMDENTRKKLFRLDETQTTAGTDNEAGTGLGLVLCKEFVERHGGQIRVESEPGNGSKFVFTLSISK